MATLRKVAFNTKITVVTWENHSDVGNLKESEISFFVYFNRFACDHKIFMKTVTMQ